MLQNYLGLIVVRLLRVVMRKLIKQLRIYLSLKSLKIKSLKT